MSFAAITLCVASQRVFIVISVYSVIDSVRKLLDTLSYITCLLAGTTLHTVTPQTFCSLSNLSHSSAPFYMTVRAGPRNQGKERGGGSDKGYDPENLTLSCN